MASTSTTAILSSRESAPPAFHVTTDAWLFRRIVSFQTGIPVALFQFGTHHDPTPPRGSGTSDIFTRLAKLVVKFGTRKELDLIRSSRILRNGRWYEPKFGWLAREAIENQRIDLLEWMVENGMHLAKPRALWRTAIHKYSGDASLRVLDLLLKVCPLADSEAHDEIPYVISRPAPPLLRWISAHYPNLEFPVGLTTTAVACGDLEAVKFLTSHPKNVGCDAVAFDIAYRRRYLDILECLIAYRAGAMTDKLREELSNDATAPIQAIVRRYPTVFWSAPRKRFLDAVRAGDNAKMEALYASGECDISEVVSIDHAATWNGLAGIEFLHELGIAEATTEAMDAAAEAKRWDIVEFLHINRTEGGTTRAADAAVKSGNINCVLFFLENRHEGCSVAAMNHAAENGHMEILRYLHQHAKVGCTSEAMDSAAANGHLRVVQFLHENRHEGGTTNAVDAASSGGFLDVVQYLCAHRAEGCTTVAVQGALENHHLGVVDLLYEHYPYRFGAEILFDLLLRGAFDIFMKLRAKFPEEAGSVVERVMFEAGKQFELRTIRFIINALGRFDLRQLALDGTRSAEATDTSQWYDAINTILANHVDTSSYVDTMLHPLLRHAQTPTWALRIIFDDQHVDVDKYNRCAVPLTWAVRAVYRHDLKLLEAIRDLSQGTAQSRRGNHFHDSLRGNTIDPFQFDGARAAAVRVGDLNIIAWLLTSVDLPIETTLLDEAVYYHRFDIAEWLLAHHSEACTELDWTNKGKEAGFQNFGLHDGLLDWLESHDAVRKALPFSGIIDFAARKNDVDSLTRLHEWYPELFTPRPSLVRLADSEECRDAINFLLEIGWSTDVFFEDC